MVTPSGVQIVYRFNGTPDGAQPRGGVTELNGTLYGTTEVGGASDGGTVFQITASGAESVLHSFGPEGSGPDGSYPYAGLIDVNGTLYGTTNGGGPINYGTVFQVSTSGAENVLHTFEGTPHGEEPTAALTDVNGTIYGTTWVGGVGGPSSGHGSIFQIAQSSGFSAIYSFCSHFRECGEMPFAGLLYVDGTLYGTTYAGGRKGRGAVFQLSL